MPERAPIQRAEAAGARKSEHKLTFIGGYNECAKWLIDPCETQPHRVVFTFWLPGTQSVPSMGADRATVVEVIMNAFDFPPEFRTKSITTNGAAIYVRTGGAG